MRVIYQADPDSFANGRSFRRAHIMITRKISELPQQLLHSLQNGELVGMGFQRRARRRELAARVAAGLKRLTAPPHPAIREARERWATTSFLRIDPAERVISSDEHPSALQTLIRISKAGCCTQITQRT